MATDFAGKTALITGAGRGIDRAVALGLVGAGASLILLARSAGQLAGTRAMLLARAAFMRCFRGWRCGRGFRCPGAGTVSPPAVSPPPVSPSNGRDRLARGT